MITRPLAQQQVLTEHERGQSGMLKLMEELDRRLQLHRSRNDNLSLDPMQTAALRGQIKEVNVILKLGRAVDSITVDDDPTGL